MRRRQQLETLEIELEEVGDSSWWPSLLAPVEPGASNAYLRFVGRVWGPRGGDSTVAVRGETFPRFGDLESLEPDDAFCPGPESCLAHLRERLEEEGWVPAGRGLDLWSHRYVRPVPPSQPSRPGRLAGRRPELDAAPAPRVPARPAGFRAARDTGVRAALLRPLTRPLLGGLVRHRA